MSEEELQPANEGRGADALSKTEIGLVLLAVVVALVSLFALPGIVATPEFWSATAQSIDNECDTVLKLIGASAGAATLVAAVPGDATTPIANQLIDIGGSLAIVLAALYLEKYLLVVLSKAALMLLVPLGCLLAVVATLAAKGSKIKEGARTAAFKFFAFALAAVFVVPCSVLVSDMVRDAYEEFGNSSYVAQALEDGDAASEENVNVINVVEGSEPGDDSDDTGLLGKVSSTLGDIKDAITGSASEFVDWASAKLNHFVEAFAVMMVTSCVIPILVLLFFLWLVNTLLGLDIKAPKMPKASGVLKHLRKDS